LSGGRASERSEHQVNMNRKAIREQVKGKGIEGAMRLPKGTLTPKMKRFAEQVALGNTGADAYRIAYNAKGKPATVGNHASQLKSQDRIKNEIERIERANELAALHSAEGLRGIVISTLAEIATNPESKDATRVQAVKAIGQLVGVDAFRETKRIERVESSSDIRQQILDQLRTITMSADVQDVDANSLLAELAEPEPHPDPTPQDAEWDSGAHMHSNPHEPPQSFPENQDISQSSEDPPSSLETQTPQGDISDELAFMALNTETPPLDSEIEDDGGDISGKN
jgi:hypothetical protein